MGATNGRFACRIAMLAILSSMICVPGAGAVTVLADGNSTVSIDPYSQAGVYNWNVNGPLGPQDQLFQQWFWYRIGNEGPETSIDAIDDTPVVTPFLGGRGVSILYAGTGFTIEATYILTGGAVGETRSDLAEIISIRNTGGSALDFHFFQYSDFDLCGAGGDSVNIVDGNRVRQYDGTCSLSETVISPGANLWEANTWPSTLNSLNDGAATDLNGNRSSGPGDVTWAYQWDMSIGRGQSFLISKDKSLQPIPEPGTLTLIGAGLAGLALRRRRKA